ncbi:hypothetical protein D3C83_07340 [compost metagenome]
MALGVPVISTEYSDIRRILPFSGQVVQPRPEDIARAVMWAHSERDGIAARQRQWVQACATIEKAAKELECVYRKYTRPVPALERREPSGAVALHSSYRERVHEPGRNR